MRTRAELRQLTDVVQIAVTIAALAVLALPWWTYVHGDHAETSTVTGWGALGDSTHGHGWALLIAVVVASITTALPQWWAPVVGAVISAVLAIAAAFGAGRLQSSHDDLDHVHAGLWVGITLVAVVVADQIAMAALRRGAARGA